MRLAHSPSRAWLCIQFLLVAAFLIQAPLAAGQGLQLPSLTPEARSRLAQAAGDATLAPWQRDLMRVVSHGGPMHAATEPSSAFPSIAWPSAGAAAEDGDWTEVRPPSARYQHTAIYDPVRDRMVVFGGSDGSPRNDVWALSLVDTIWSALSPAGSPPSARSSPTAIYDPVRDRMVVFGGNDGGPRNDVWALSLAGSPAWSALAPAGNPPTARYYHAAIYDPVRDRMVVFGGNDDSLRNDVWALSLAGTPAWSALAPAGSPPSARYSPTAIYDPVRDRMVVFGGNDSSSFHNDVWALSLAGSPAWSALAPAGSPPSARYQHTAFYDPVRDRMVVFAGNDSLGFRNDAWALSLAGSPAWSVLAPTGSPPSARYAPTAIYDPGRDRMVVFGGYDASASHYRDDVWALSLAGIPDWDPLVLPWSPPSARYFHSAFYDPVRDRLVVFGGYDASASHYRNDVWALSLAGKPVWNALAPAGSLPPARIWHTAFYDALRDRMVVFGGYDGVGLRNDVWALSLAGSPTWSALAPTGSPPSARYSATALYDPVRDRMVVFGGNDGVSLRNDVWALSLGSPAWSVLAPSGSPPVARYQHTAIYDAGRDRMVVFGGYDGAGPRNDVWALSLAASPDWSALAPAGPPSERFQHTAIYDPARDRMVVFGGNDDRILRNDVWALSLAGSPSWSVLALAGSPPIGRSDHTAVYDQVRGRMVAFGGYGNVGGQRNDVWALAWAPPLPVPAKLISLRFELAPPRPNPSRGETFVDFELAVPARVVLDVFDAQGRRVKRIADEWFTAGPHVSSWRGDDEREHAVGSGVYFLRIQVGGFQATRRAVRVH